MRPTNPLKWLKTVYTQKRKKKEKKGGLSGSYPLSDLRDSHEERHGGTGADVTLFHD